MKPKLDPQKMFLEAYNDFNDAIFRHCFFRISDREKARELTQEAFMRYWSYLSQNKNIQNIKALLYRIANNLIIDEYRKKKTDSLEELSEKGFEPSDARLEIHTDSIEIKEIVVMLNKLDNKYKQAFVMRHIDGLSLKEIAEATGESEGNISIRIHRATKQLKNLLNNNG